MECLLLFIRLLFFKVGEALEAGPRTEDIPPYMQPDAVLLRVNDNP